MGEEGEQSLTPHHAPDRVLDYQSSGATRFVPLRRMRAMEAQLARVKLESEGIRCFIADQLINQADPLLFASVELQVAEEDAQMAAWILDDRPGDVRPDEYVDEAWRCPVCHRRNVELLPLRGGWRVMKLLFIFTLLSPFMIALAEWVVPIPAFVSWSEEMLPRFFLVWPIVSGILALALLSRHREKRCQECGHVWIDKKQCERRDADEADSTDHEPDDECG
jgi:hypothetical protein